MRAAAFPLLGTGELHAARAHTASADRWLTALLLALIVGGAVLRIHGVAEPRYFTFDEELFVKNAQNYLVGLPDANDHPPLGKLLMSVGLLLFGYNSLGWRFSSLCFGLEIPLLGFWLARSLFRDKWSAWFAAAFLASDGFFIAYSRAGLLDGMLTCFVLASALCAANAKNLRGVVLTAVVIGLATSIKWSGVMSVFPAAALLIWRRRVRFHTLLAFALVPVVHVAVWLLGLAIAGQPHDLHTLWRLMQDLFWHHLELGHHQNALASRWYTWLGLYHPIVVKLSQHGEAQRYASSAGNPLLWLSASAVALALPLFWAFYAFRRRLPLERALLEPNRTNAALSLVIGWFALFAPWIVARGSYTFMYHYLPSYAFALVALAAVVAAAKQRFPRSTLGFSALVLAVAAYYAPVWGELPLTESQANQRLLFPSWRP